MHKAVSRKNIALLTVLALLWCTRTLSQNPQKIPLTSVIEQVETAYNVSISYATSDVSGIVIIPPAKENSLENTLRYLTQNTPLRFTRIDDRYITATLKNGEALHCGRVYDAETGLPLSDVTVQTIDGSFATVTNSEGIFYLAETSPGASLRISHVGYETTEILADRLTGDCFGILLLPSVTALTTITLETLFTQGIQKSSDGSITLKTENFGLLPGQVENDVLQIAQALPGVESADETISNINIRGGTHDENLILYEDIKMYQSGHFFGLISAFNPDLTKEVTLYKNGTPSRYGEGVSGVIDMRSKDKVTSNIEGGLGVNLINGNFYLDIPVSERSSMQLSGRHSINSLFETPVYKTYSEKIFQDTEITNQENPFAPGSLSVTEDFSFYDISTKFLWDLSEKDRLRFTIFTVDNKLDFTETLETSSASKTSNLKQRSLLGGFSWMRTWSGDLKTTALVYGSYYLLDAVNNDIFTTQVQLQENEVIDAGFKLDGSYRLSETLHLDGGYHFSETGIANLQDVNLPRFRIYEKKVLRSHVLFSDLIYTSSSKNTILRGGVRANYYEKFDRFLPEPRFSAHQKLGGGFALEALGELKSQTVTQRIDFDSDFLGIEKRRWVLANEMDTPIIQSKQFSAGLVFKKSKWFVNLEGFYKHVDGITASNQGFQNQFQFVDAQGSYASKGAEFTLNRKTDRFSAWFTYLYMQNDYTFTTLYPDPFPHNLDIRHSLTAAGSYTLKRLKFALGFNYHTGKPNTFPRDNDAIEVIDGEETIIYAQPNTQRLSNYYRTDVSAEYLWELSESVDAKINLAVLNLLNQKNTLNIRYALDTDASGNARINQVKEVSLGFTPNVSVQVLF
ncbi:carboxypeptidase-like regulatory domain-containing protein [Altibacter lentus]|uniref:carboxypeptidase-like regulatory domain-containing protein n=1 Tax=Altibacter lentus TaxID=1223410 RepID=UPI00055526DF|nr:carboxypeptidase-like regulatory domain-containing protein [Altibacter lentus]